MLASAKQDSLVAGRGFYLRVGGGGRVSVWVLGNHVKVRNTSIMTRSINICWAVCVDMYASV